MDTLSLVGLVRQVTAERRVVTAKYPSVRRCRLKARNRRAHGFKPIYLRLDAANFRQKNCAFPEHTIMVPRDSAEAL